MCIYGCISAKVYVLLMDSNVHLLHIMCNSENKKVHFGGGAVTAH